MLLSGAASLNRHRATVFSLTGNSPVKSVCDVKIDLIATRSPPSAFGQNIINPTSEKTHLVATNDGSFFSDLGEKIVVGGWINPTTYSVGQTYIPIFNTRQGPGQPIFYVSLFQGRLRLMLYNDSGSLIYDQTETPTITLKNNGWYFIASVIEVNKET